MTPTEVRLQLRTFGYAPIPLRGKNPGMKTGWQWQTLHDAGADQIKMWGKVFGDAGNTGVLTRLTPAFDIDILDQDAADAVEQLARDFHEEHGDFLVRFGRAPKRAVLFRTNEPFTKLQALLIAPDGEHQKLEVLGDGQQLVVDESTPIPRRHIGGSPARPGPHARSNCHTCAKPTCEHSSTPRSRSWSVILAIATLAGASPRPATAANTTARTGRT